MGQIDSIYGMNFSFNLLYYVYRSKIIRIIQNYKIPLRSIVWSFTKRQLISKLVFVWNLFKKNTVNYYQIFKSRSSKQIFKSGLDPAGFGFDFGYNLDRLDAGAAQYVQCIHTSQGTLGTQLDCGHANFILNGGWMQPGCFNIMCSHSRATAYFIESLSPINKFIAEKCDDTFMYYTRKLLMLPCTNIIDKLGIHSARLPGRFFLETRSSAPYALTWNTSKPNTILYFFTFQHDEIS